MTSRYAITFAPGARKDLLRVFDFLLQRDEDAAARARDAIASAMKMLEAFPFSCRKAAGGELGPRMRELVIPFGSSGYVALFEIDGPATVTILAVRHQREQDYH